MASKQILEANKVERILHRMAFEIWEKNYDAKRIILAGISNKGSLLAKMLEKKLKFIKCNLVFERIEVFVDKENPSVDTVTMSKKIVHQKGDVVIVIDDVLYTGSTLTHAVIPFIEMGITKVQTAVLIFRDYLRYPIRADYIGISMASTTQEHVEVTLEENNSTAYLN